MNIHFPCCWRIENILSDQLQHCLSVNKTFFLNFWGKTISFTTLLKAFVVLLTEFRKEEKKSKARTKKSQEGGVLRSVVRKTGKKVGSSLWNKRKLKESQKKSNRKARMTMEYCCALRLRQREQGRRTWLSDTAGKDVQIQRWFIKIITKDVKMVSGTMTVNRKCV